MLTVCKVKSKGGFSEVVTIMPSDDVAVHGIPLEAIVGELRRPLDSSEPIKPEDLAINRVFVEFLHKVVAGYAPHLAELKSEAKKIQNSGWVYVIDERSPVAKQDSVLPEDIVGAFEAKNGRLIPESYKPNNKYKILSKNGFFKMDRQIYKQLINELHKLNK